MHFFAEEKFLSLSITHQHKVAGELLREIYEGSFSKIESYELLQKWLKLPPLDFKDFKDFKALSDRYHDHLELAKVHLKEHNLLPLVAKADKFSPHPFLDIAIYLDNLRSASNVGNIIRTVEALRLGSIYFGGKTPFIDNPKVEKTSMGTSSLVPCYNKFSLDDLPRPFIALETIASAPSIYEATFPSSFTLILGNEEYGISDALLAEADFFIQIPLFGNKNSLNVSNAFAITASTIRNR